MARSTWEGRIYNFIEINGLQSLSPQITWNHVLTRKPKTVNPNFSFPKRSPKVTSDLTLGDLRKPEWSYYWTRSNRRPCPKNHPSSSPLRGSIPRPEPA